MKKFNEKLNNVNNVKKVKLVNYNARLNFILIIIFILFAILIIGLTYVSLIKGSEYKKLAINQQLVSREISPKRGNIFDRNGELLAQSVEVDTVSINPKLLKTSNGKDIDKELFSKKISEIFGLELEKVREKVNKNSEVETIAKKVDSQKILLLKNMLKENDIAVGVNIDKDSKRYYPYGKIASNIIGFCGYDNNGIEGLEKLLDKELTGKYGKIVSVGDVNQGVTKEDPEQVINKEDGKDIYLTLDVQIQGIVEKVLEETVKEHNADSGIAIVMNPKNAEILAMSNYPTFNLNEPYAPVGMSEALWNKLDSQTRSNRLYDIWKNKSVTNLYEPGSVFKLVLASIALEENITTEDNLYDFYCSGVQKVQDRDIRCWSKVPHGNMSLRKAVHASCNPSFIQLGQRLGKELLFKYMRAYGFFEKTGANLIGESNGIFHNYDNIRDVELATMSIGQRFNTTPLQMINTSNTIVNGGNLLKPQIIKKMKDNNTGAIDTFKVEEVRKVISEETSKKMKSILRGVVTEGTGKLAAIPEYTVGGKSGTSEPPPDKPEDGYTVSFYAVSPAEDPEIGILFIIKNPKNGKTEGSNVAAPAISKILKEIMPRIMNNKVVQNIPVIKTEDVKQKIEVQNIIGKTVNEAKQILQNSGLGIETGPVSNVLEIIVETQNPPAGTLVNKDSKIYITTNEKKENELVTVPNLAGMNKNHAIQKILDLELNYEVNNKTGNVISQNIESGQMVKKGTIIQINVE